MIRIWRKKAKKKIWIWNKNKEKNRRADKRGENERKFVEKNKKNSLRRIADYNIHQVVRWIIVSFSIRQSVYCVKSSKKKKKKKCYVILRHLLIVCLNLFGSGRAVDEKNGTHSKHPYTHPARPTESNMAAKSIHVSKYALQSKVRRFLSCPCIFAVV